MIEKYQPSFAARVRDLCYLGATATEIAYLLGVTPETLKRWRDEIPEFAHAWKIGAKEADAKVAASLFKRACGYTTQKWKETKDGRFFEEVQVAPDVTACIFWLTNRAPEQWVRQVQQLPDGGNIPSDSLTEIEMARRVAFVLARGAFAAVEDQRNRRSIENGSDRPEPPETK